MHICIKVTSIKTSSSNKSVNEKQDQSRDTTMGMLSSGLLVPSLILVTKIIPLAPFNFKKKNIQCGGERSYLYNYLSISFSPYTL